MFDIFQSEECIADALKELAKCKYSRSKIIERLEMLHLNSLDIELNYLYDMPMPELRAFVSKWKMMDVNLFDLERVE